MCRHLSSRRELAQVPGTSCNSHRRTSQRKSPCYEGFLHRGARIRTGDLLSEPTSCNETQRAESACKSAVRVQESPVTNCNVRRQAGTRAVRAPWSTFVRASRRGRARRGSRWPAQCVPDSSSSRPLAGREGCPVAAIGREASRFSVGLRPGKDAWGLALTRPRPRSLRPALYPLVRHHLPPRAASSRCRVFFTLARISASVRCISFAFWHWNLACSIVP